MEYIKTYIILYKSNTRVIYFCYMLNCTFILTGCREVSVCIQYDMMLVFSSETKIYEFRGIPRYRVNSFFMNGLCHPVHVFTETI